jgi:hypothetical protein
MKFRLLSVLILLCAATVLTAGNSSFSYYGMPCRNYGNDIYGITMGNTGLSDIFRRNMGYGNPAILGSTNRTLFSTGLMFGWTSYKSDYDGLKKSYRDDSMDFPFFSIAVPVNNHHFGFQFNSYSSGEVQNRISFTNVTDLGDTLLTTEIRNVDQYVYRADVMYAFHYQHINLGAGLNYYFGHDIRRVSQDADFTTFNSVYKLENSFKNPAATLGATADWNNLAAGLYYSLGATLEGSRTLSTIFNTEDLGTARYAIPSEIGAGVTGKFAEEYKVSTDFVMNFWKSAKYSTYDRDSWKLSLGLAHEPKEGARKTFLGKLVKRAGIYTRELPFTANGQTINETAVSAGITFPIKQSENRLDFGLQYMWRGNVAQNNLQDRSLMFMVGITGFDILTKASNRSAPREIPTVEEIAE